MKVLILDNYDSFTYNLVQIVERLIDKKADVYRNDKISLEKVSEYDKIVLSPGPGLPAEAGMMPQIIKQFAAEKDILGVCLGHQAIAESFGGKLMNLPEVFHGVATQVKLTNAKYALRNEIFTAIPDEFSVGRYHSWVVDSEQFPNELEVTAEDENGQIMALRHVQYNLQGVQFHPESILTPFGNKMIENWLKN